VPSRHRSPLRQAPTAPSPGASSTTRPQPGSDGAPAIRVALLGGFELGVGGRVVRIPVHAQRLVAFLALHDRPLHRAYVAGRLWIDVSQEQAHNSLRSTLWRMRGPSRPVVDTSSTHLALAAAVEVDARELEAAARRVLHRESLAVADIDQLVNADDLLVDWYEDWIVEERDRLRQLRLLALETACTELVAADRCTEALVAGAAAVAEDPLRESATRALIAAHGAAGNVAEALRRYETYRSSLADALELAPSQHMTTLIRSIVPERA
jgi:DNA-binding SARP family transcriptional activator